MIKNNPWIDATKEVPSNGNKVLAAWVEEYDGVGIFNYGVATYNRYLQDEWMKDTEVIKVDFWQKIVHPNKE